MPDIDALLSPRSIAIVGASPDATIIRGKVQHVLHARKYPGKIYPISRSNAEVQGVKAYPTIAEVPEKVDLAMIIIPAAAVPAALTECGEAGVKAAYIISSGFAEERGIDGAGLQRQIREIADKYDMAICGPNAEGFFNAPDNVVATFSPAVENFEQPLQPETDKGLGIGVVAQSGGLGFAYYHRGRARQLRINHLISTGNEAALEGFDLVEYLLERDDASVFLMYLEAIRNAETFKRVAARAADLGKPLIVAKMGRSEVASRAAASHTAALSGSDTAYDAMFERYGVIRGDEIDQMLDIAAGFAFCPPLKGRRVAIMSGSGGAAVWMADTLAAHGLDVPELDAETRKAIDAIIPSYGASANPVDLTAQAIRQVGYARIIDILRKSPVIDAIVVVGSLANPATIRNDREALAKVAAETDKPILFCTYTLPSPEGVEVITQCGIPAYANMPNCAAAIAAMADYHEFRQRRAASQATAAAAPAATAPAAALETFGKVLCEYEAKSVLAPYGVRAEGEQLARTAAEAVAAARSIGYPVAIKIQSPDITHKTEMGGVELRLADDRAVETAFETMMARAREAAPSADIRGVLVQKMAPAGREIILGISHDETFGPMLMLGLGGIYVEVLRDVVFAPVPLGRDDALAMIKRLKGSKLLEGVRGEPPSDVDALADLMVGLARFAADNAGRIAEIDLNPVLVHPRGEGVTVVDALIVQRDQGA